MTIVVDLGQNKQNTNVSASTKIAASTKFAAGRNFCATSKFCAGSNIFASRNCASSKFCASRNFCARRNVCAINSRYFFASSYFGAGSNFVLAGIFVFCLFCCFTSPSHLLWPWRDGQLTLSHLSRGTLKKRLTSTLSWERECLTRDLVAAGSSLTGGVALRP